MIKQAIIPLAGLGTRLLPLTSVIPKELLPINGKPGLEYILDELSILKEELKNNIKSDTKLEELYQSLKIINARLWVIEDDKRKCEKEKDFTENFIKLSRDVHILNDDRAKIKLKINEHTGSKIKEIKEYTSY